MRFACAELLLVVALTGCKREEPLVVPLPVAVVKPAASSKKFELPPTGFRLAWVSEVSGAPQIVVDGVTLTAGAPHYLSAVTPRGELLVTRAQGESEQLIALQVDAGTRALSPPCARARNATASATRVLFEGPGAGLASLRDERGELIIDDAAGSFEPSLAPDGTWFAYVSSVDGDAEIYRASIDGGQRTRLTAFHLDDVRPRISPDGKWVCFASNREGSDRLFLIKPDGRGTRRLHPEDISRESDGGVEAAEADAVWSADSKSVTFSARGHGGKWHLFRVDVASGAMQQLTDGAFDDQSPAPTPDGKWTAFVSDRAGDAELFVLAPDGGTLRVTTQAGSDWMPMWLQF